MAEDLGINYVLRRSDGMYYHPGGDLKRWRSTVNTFARKGILTRAIGADIKKSWKPRTKADYEIITVRLMVVE